MADTTLDELLSDPMVQLVMARDHVRPEGIRLMLERDRYRTTGNKKPLSVPPAHVIAACSAQRACF